MFTHQSDQQESSPSQDNVVHIRQQKSKIGSSLPTQPIDTAIGKLERYDRVVGHIMKEVSSANEATVLNYIFAHTKGWSRDEVYLKYDYFVKGSPLDMKSMLKERSVRNAVKTLEDKNMIQVTRKREGNWFKINYAWEPDQMPRLPEPKKKNTSKKTPEPARDATPNRHHMPVKTGTTCHHNTGVDNQE